MNVRAVKPGRSTLTEEAERIQARSRHGETVIVRLGRIIFFCANRDAWMFDPEDGFARCLMRDGEAQPLGIFETRKQFSIEWNADYRIGRDVFEVTERETGATRSIAGYPTREISPLN